MDKNPHIAEPDQSHILVVDDDASVCETYRRSLTLAGHFVHVAAGYEEAVHILREHKLDTVVSDIFLGDRDGLDILEQSHQIDPDIPVILVTGLPTIETASEAVRLRAYEYLSKPVHLGILIDTVNRAIHLKSERTRRKRLEIQKHNYQRNLEHLVADRTKKLIDSNKRYQLLFENSKDAIFMAAWDGSFLTLNRSALEMFDYHEDELRAGNTLALFSTTTRYTDFLREIEKIGFVKDFEVSLVKKHGAPVECLLTAHLLRRGDGEIEGYQGIIRDISSQKKAEQKIRSQNTFLTNVLESLAHPFMVVDANDFSIKIANKAAYSNRSPDNQTCHALNHGHSSPCDDPEERCPIREVVATGKPVHLEHAHRYADQQVVKNEVHAFPLKDAQGNVSQVILYCIDITEKKILESIAEAANLMDNLGYIFAGIRHEIGNPINSLKMALSVLIKHLDTYPIETIREFVERALNETSRVEYLLKALKNFSLYESLTPESTPLAPFLRHFIALVEKDFSAQGIRIQFDLPDEEVIVLTDQRAFHQVMLNLMTNAADALKTQPDPVIQIGITPLSGYVKITVTDNGCGITMDNQRNLFRPFYTSKRHGTGLGLMIVKKMLSKMNSSIRITSTHQQGTTVTMMLPQTTQEGEVDGAR